MNLKLFTIYVLWVLRLIICLPILPVIYWLGKKIKSQIPDLPAASLHLSGTIGEKHEHLKLLLIGESSIAGVGIDDHMEGIPGTIGRVFLTQDKAISWQVVARSGFKAIDVINQLVPTLPHSKADVIIVGLGGNDTFQMTPPWRWRSHMKQLVGLLRDGYPDAHVIVSAMPPVADFPIFPWILQKFMGGQTNMLRLTIRDFPVIFSKLSYLSEKVRMQEWVEKSDGLTLSDFFSDGVHPSAVTYQLIGQAIGEEILSVEYE